MLTDKVELEIEPNEVNDDFFTCVFTCIESGVDLDDDGIRVLPEMAFEDLGMKGIPEFLVLLSDVGGKYPKRVSKETLQFVLIRKSDVEVFKERFMK